NAGYFEDYDIACFIKYALCQNNSQFMLEYVKMILSYGHDLNTSDVLKMLSAEKYEKCVNMITQFDNL
ncbi:MAG: hypothetical protein ACYCPT_12255, partial [Acidimicrobiales bacterium]